MRMAWIKVIKEDDADGELNQWIILPECTGVWWMG